MTSAIPCTLNPRQLVHIFPCNFINSIVDMVSSFDGLVNIPVEGIRLLDAVCLLQRCGLSLVSSAPKKWRLTRWPVDLFKNEPLKGNSEVHLHTPTKIGEDPSKDLGGVGEQTNKRCSNYSMTMIQPLMSIYIIHNFYMSVAVSSFCHIIWVVFDTKVKIKVSV